MRVAASGRTTTAFMHWLCCAFVFWFSGAVFASDALGLAWLQAQVRADGSLAQEGVSAALPVQGRAEVATTLQAMAGTVPAVLLNAIDQTSGTSVEILARKALAKQLTAPSTAYLDALAQQQNPDGGFGAAQGYSSNVQDTAWALHALAATQSSSVVAEKALDWLISSQQLDGQWMMAFDGDAVVTTSMAVQALAAYRQQPAVQAALAKARAWLIAQRNANQLWSDDLRTAHALLAVLPGLMSASEVQAAVTALKASQASDGSWADDPHLTALILRALTIAAQPVTNPDMASVTGMLLDSQSRAPLVGFTANLRGAASLLAVVGATGSFEFTALTPGPYTLEVPAQGQFQALRADIALIPGQRLDVGQLLLNRNVIPSAATVFGKVTRADTGAGIAGATIQVGSLTARSGPDGSYQLLEVPPGDVTVMVSAAGFRGAAGKVVLQAGSTAIFSPILALSPSGGPAARPAPRPAVRAGGRARAARRP